ncbi:zinc-binding dehydrogenase [Novosphingobium sp. 9U]|uniref:zinc-binding dehydrogenase n=1 Tax=Novosphingobium sp. 9U TaxID=2653158 RepID=UPI0012F14596|nr:zinc-binding dehydrogenase [Novosphingobium sp. 9U]VWX50613.1 Alcohol dehydrogenase class-3 [Novosphingobium sp. 9U]
MKTRAAICVEPGHALEVDMVDVRGPGPGEVLIEIRASGLCHSDWHQISGDLPLYPYPIIVGHEGAGVVLEVGPGVSSVQPGDHVIPVSIPECRQCAACTSGRTNLCSESFASFSRTETPFSRNGQPIFMYSGVSTFANHTVVKEIAVVKIRDDAPFGTVCCAGCAVITGVGAVFKTAAVRPQSSVAVFGIGGVGLNILQAARMAGATKIIAVDINPARLEIAQQFGASHCVNPKTIDCDLVAHLQALTGGGADFSFECVGIPQLMLQAIETVRPGWGVSVAVGAAGMDNPVQVPSFAILSGRTWKGSLLGDVRPRTELPGIVDLYMDGHLDVDSLVTHRLPLERINEGFELMRRGEAIRAVIEF